MSRPCLNATSHSSCWQVRMVESLGLMWEEERGRCGGADPPPPPPDPSRCPKPLCRVVEHIRSQYQASAGLAGRRVSCQILLGK